MPVLIEGYTPPTDPRLRQVRVTPDPGVIEVNTQPAASWAELVANTIELYEQARQTRLGTEKFMLMADTPEPAVAIIWYSAGPRRWIARFCVGPTCCEVCLATG